MDFLSLSVIVTVAFFPPLLYMAWIRNTERYEREPWRAVFRSFIGGATVGIGMAAILEVILVHFYSSSLDFLRGYELIAKNEASINAIIIAGLIAPFIEEATKIYGITVSRREIDEIEDGIVYGASSGFGFASMENLLYEISALISGGFTAWLTVSIIRSLSSALLHGSATAMSGLGYSLHKFHRGSLLRGYLTAVGMHSSFNVIASIPIILSGINPLVYLFPLGIGIFYGITAFSYIRRKIRYYDRPHRPRAHRR